MLRSRLPLDATGTAKLESGGALASLRAPRSGMDSAAGGSSAKGSASAGDALITLIPAAERSESLMDLRILQSDKPFTFLFLPSVWEGKTL